MPRGLNYFFGSSSNNVPCFVHVHEEYICRAAAESRVERERSASRNVIRIGEGLLYLELNIFIFSKNTNSAKSFSFNTTSTQYRVVHNNSSHKFKHFFIMFIFFVVLQLFVSVLCLFTRHNVATKQQGTYHTGGTGSLPQTLQFVTNLKN